MMMPISCTRAVLVALLVAAPAVAAPQAPLGVNADAEALTDFNQRVAAYVEVHQRAEAALPGLADMATPEEINAHKLRLGADLRAARPTAAQGDLFTTRMQALVRRIIADLVAQPEGREVVAAVMEENPRGSPVAVNDSYPDALPLTTMPPQLLKALPEMPEELEYRFIGASLVILDQHAHLIVDFVPNALPE